MSLRGDRDKRQRREGEQREYDANALHDLS
jgi:hypothetical protein